MELVDGKTLRELVALGEPLPTQKLLDLAVADRRRAGQGARGRHRAPGPEARERDGLEGRLRQDPGLRPGQADRAGRSRTVSALPTAVAAGDAAGHGAGHGRLHVAGAGQRAARRLPLRPVLARLDPLRDGDGQARLPEEDRRRDAVGDHPGGARADRAGCARRRRLPCAGSSSAASPRIREERYASTQDLARDLTSVRDHLSRDLRLRRPRGAPSRRRARRRGWALPAAPRPRSRVAASAWLAAQAVVAESRLGPDPVPAADVPARHARQRRASLPTARRSSTARPGTGTASRSSRREPTAPSPASLGLARRGAPRDLSTGELADLRSTAGACSATRRPGRSPAFRWPAARRARSSRTSRTPTGRPDGKSLAVAPASTATEAGSSTRSARCCYETRRLGQRRPRFAGRDASSPSSSTRSAGTTTAIVKVVDARASCVVDRPVRASAAAAWPGPRTATRSGPGSDPGDLDRRQDRGAVWAVAGSRRSRTSLATGSVLVSTGPRAGARSSASRRRRRRPSAT